VIEGVVGEEALGLGGGEEGIVAADEGEGELMNGQGPAVAQGHGQLYGIVGFERMASCQGRSYEKVVTVGKAMINNGSR
jgi:hypothetical protein